MKPTILPFPAPSIPEVVGVLPHRGGQVMVTVVLGARPPRLQIYDPATGFQVTQDLTRVVWLLDDAAEG